MCFSATASFTAAAVLVPAGMYCLKKSNQIDKRYWAFAMMPFMFGLQQLFEGGVWVALMEGDAASARSLALGFLLFSHLFWLGWIPYSSYRVESSPRLKRVFLLITLTGVLLGAFMYVPLLLKPAWLTASIVKHAINYDLIFFSDAYVSQQVVTAFYACVILVPLMLSSDRYHRLLGGLIVLSGIFSWAFFDWVFVSVWCYFAAVISLYIFIMIARSAQAAQVPGVAR